MSEINHYRQCARCNIRRAYKKPRSRWDHYDRPSYTHNGKWVYMISECGSCETERKKRYADMAIDKK